VVRRKGRRARFELVVVGGDDGHVEWGWDGRGAGDMWIWTVGGLGSVDCLVSRVHPRAIKNQRPRSSSTIVHRPACSSPQRKSFRIPPLFSFIPRPQIYQCQSPLSVLLEQIQEQKERQGQRLSREAGPYGARQAASPHPCLQRHGDRQSRQSLPSFFPDARSHLPSAATELSCEDPHSGPHRAPH